MDKPFGEASAITARKQEQEAASWYRPVLAAILALSAFLNLFHLTSDGYGNTYYAATVKDMLTSWHNFFFVSFDAGFVSVDKPPLALWIQAASAWIFGFHGWALLLPQAIAGLLSVAVLYYLVRRSVGPVAALLAALALAVTPIVVATSRSNAMDMLLVLTVLLATWAVMVAAERGSLGWLVVGTAVVGVGFNIKMLEAFLVLPAFYLLYLVAAPVTWRRRFVHLGVATLVLLVVSLSWAMAVDLTPAEQRPYVASSSNNTEMDLIVNTNGVERLTKGQGNRSGEIGYPGPLRLLSQPLAAQIGWLLPLATVGLIAASWQKRPRLPLDRQQGSLVLWGTWLATQVVFFSVAGHFHPYYLVMLAPAIAALVGAGVVALWSDYQRSPGWRGWLLPLTLAGMAALQIHILAPYYADWGRWLSPLVAGLCLIVAMSLVVARLTPRLKARRTYLLAATSVGVLSLLVAPSIWAGYSAWHGTETNYPAAGPQVQHQKASSDDAENVDPGLMNYLEANRGNAKYLVAATDARSAAPIILRTAQSVVSTGDYHGQQAFGIGKLAELMNGGAVRFFVADSASMKKLAQHPKNRGGVMGWVQDNCEQVSQEEWQSSTSKQAKDPAEEALLYDCGTGTR